jgi:hypothetical protein
VSWRGRVEAERISPASGAVQEVGIDEGREYRFNLDRFQSPQPAGLFRSDAEMWRLLELLANKLDPVTYPAGAVGMGRGGDRQNGLAGCVPQASSLVCLRQAVDVQETDQSDRPETSRTDASFLGEAGPLAC